MTPNPASTPFTADFKEEFARETDTLLRHRFLLFTAIMGTLAIVALVLRLLLPLAPEPLGTWVRAMLPTGGRTTLYILLSVLWATAYVAAFALAVRKKLAPPAMLKATAVLLFTDGSLGVVFQSLGLPAGGWLFFTMTHLIACVLLPITLWQAAWPVLAVAGFAAVMRIPLWSENWIAALFISLVTPLVGGPGVLIAWFRHARRVGHSKVQFFSRRYGEMRRELVDARRLHESLFPAPITAGAVRLDYRYQPMRQIGGDFLFVHRGPADDGIGVVTSLVLLDVTGHGIPAALTVNRLHGELDRVFAEDPSVGPGRVLSLLNRYVHLTLAHHSVYASAVCFRFDPTKSELNYASGGHPPAFLRSVDGKLDELHSTALVLGAAADCDYEPFPETRRFAAGDSLLVYTDGAIEARDEGGRMLKIAGLQRVLAGSSQAQPGRLADAIIDAVDRHRHGPPADDTLVVEVFRPLRAETKMEVLHDGAASGPAKRSQTTAAPVATTTGASAENASRASAREQTASR